jgi:cell division protein FtsA
MPVRVGSPQGVGGLMDQIGNPAFSTSIGLLLWGAHHLGDEPIGYAGGNGTNPLSRVGEWVRNLFPG